MAIYTTLRVGSSGSGVKKLQQALSDAGYSLGSYGVDGQYGSVTQAAVRQYQQDNGLTVDGVAGDETLGSLYASGSTTNTTPPTADTNTSVSTQSSTTSSVSETDTDTSSTTTGDATALPALTVSAAAYDPSTDAAYQAALQSLAQASANEPTYEGSYDDQLASLYDQIANRKSFSYDLGSDLLYQQYRDQYVTLGEQAMRDTIGQASGLTGGYASTYAESAGQQQYNAYLQRLNDIIPDLYSLALDQYNAEGDRLTQLYSLTADAADDEYSRYQDAYDRWQSNRAYYQELADTQYDRSRQSYEDAYSHSLDAYDRAFSSAQAAYSRAQDAYDRAYTSEKDAYSRSQDAYDRLYTLIASAGYDPTDAELSAAGMSRTAADALLAAYRQSLASSGGGGSSSGSGRGSSSSKSSSSKSTASTSSSKASGATSMITNSKASTTLVKGVSQVNTAQKLVGVDTSYVQTNASLSSAAKSTLASLQKKKAAGTSTSGLLSLLRSKVKGAAITRAEATAIAKQLGFTYSESRSR